MLWPVDRPAGTSAASQGLLSDRGSRLAWAGLSIGFAALSMLPANLTSTAMSTAFKAGGGMSPAPLASLDAALSRLSPGQGGPVAIALAAVELAIGAAIFRDRWRYAAVLAGCTFALAIWVTVQGLGGLSTGQATDPDTGPLLILTAAALYGLGGVRGGR